MIRRDDVLRPPSRRPPQTPSASSTRGSPVPSAPPATGAIFSPCFMACSLACLVLVRALRWSGTLAPSPLRAPVTCCEVVVQGAAELTELLDSPVNILDALGEEIADLSARRRMACRCRPAASCLMSSSVRPSACACLMNSPGAPSRPSPGGSRLLFALATLQESTLLVVPEASRPTRPCASQSRRCGSFALSSMVSFPD